jgi:hypothetical protein
MSVRKTKTGTCHICGNIGDLSFEHTPPQKAYNDKRFIKIGLERAISAHPEELNTLKGPIQQGGIGEHTLCPRCNGDTGRWYAPKFIDWCTQAKDVLNRSNGDAKLVHSYNIFPLAILKQVVTMFFSINNDTFRKENQELVSFVKNKENKYLSDRYHFYTSHNIEGYRRFSGINAQSGSSNITSITEISFPPLGYLMTVDSELIDTPLSEITYFSKYEYSECKTLTLTLPILPTYTIFPGDYRTKDKI